MELKIIKVSILFSILMTGCYYDVEEELYPTLECQTEDVNYSEEVINIIEGACNKCHSAAQNFGNITLEGYDELKKYIDR